MEHRDNKNFAKALSGFANSNGGIIVWGIIPRKDDTTQIDCAVELKPIENISLFCTKLNEFTGQCVSPIVEGVRNRKIKTVGSKGSLYSPPKFPTHRANGWTGPSRVDINYLQCPDSVISEVLRASEIQIGIDLEAQAAAPTKEF